jgi:hypothetical protein
MAQKIFKSKIDQALVIVPFVFFMVVTGFMVYGEERISAILVTGGILLSTALFIAYIAHAMRYMINDGILYVQCGILYRKHLEISRITSIKRTRDPISAPAASLDRLHIAFDTHSILIVSPAHREAFVQRLLESNPNIIQSIIHGDNGKNL